MDRPYVIAVNALDILTGQSAITEALLGDEVLDVVETAAGYHERPGRKSNGAFGSPSKPRNQVVSSVLVFTPLRLDTLGTCKVRLYHNPWANRPYTGALTKCPQRAVRDGRYVDVDGVSLGDLLGFPSNWPEQADS